MGVCLDMVPPGAEELSAESEKEEGEIIDVDEYEDISSDEEFNLRQRIEELESRNLELEKIASISSTSKLNKYDLGCIDLVDEDSSPPSSTYVHHHRHRSSRHAKAERLPTTSCRRKRNKISRHDVDHHYEQGSRSTKQEQRRKDRASRQTATTRTPKVAKSRGHVHAFTRPRTPPVAISSSSEEDTAAYRPDRRELRAALKRDTATPKSKVTSSLKRKLLGVQKSVAKFIASKAEEEEEESDLSASIEIMELLETLSDQNIIQDMTGKESKSVSLHTTEPLVDSAMPTVLEEQELRLAVLKSAILKKHENRKKRRVIEARPYSPTDTDILLDDSEQLFVDTKSALESMEISPPMSPDQPDKILLSVDMDIASDASKSPIYAQETNPLQCFNVNNQWIPMPPDAIQDSSDISAFSIFQSHTTLLDPPPPPAPPMPPSESHATHMEDEEEEALRALLLSSQQSKKKRIDAPVDTNPVHMELVDSDADDLRALVLESLRKKTEPRKSPTMISLKKAVARLNRIPKPAAHPEPTKESYIVPLKSILVERSQLPTQPIRTLITIHPTASKPTVPVVAKPVAKRKQIDHPAVVTLPQSTSKSIASADQSTVAIPPAKQPRRSALVTNQVFKPIRPVIIRFTPGGSSSSDDSDDPDPAGDDSNDLLAPASNSLDRFFDPSSPASIAMDSPAYAPSSPCHAIEMGNSNPATGDNTDATTTLPTSSSAFEQKLDEYLRNVRSKNALPAKLSTDAPKTPTIIDPKPRQRATPLVVRHLPLSAQIEYRQLVQRMRILEKQKRARDPTRSRTKADLSAAAQPFVPSSGNIATASRPDSLVKKVLVKSANDADKAKQTAKLVSQEAVERTVSVPVEPTPPAIVDSLVGLAKKFVTVVQPPVDVTPPVENQREALANTEAEMEKHSHAFLGELNTIHQLIQSAQVVRRKQVRIQRQRDRLRDQLRAVEQALGVEEAAINQIYPAITRGHKSIRTNRQKWLVLRDRCKVLGTEVTGTEYSPPLHEAKQIEQQMRSVLEETRKLKAIKTSDIAGGRNATGATTSVISKEAASAPKSKVVMDPANNGPKAVCVIDPIAKVASDEQPKKHSENVQNQDPISSDHVLAHSKQQKGDVMSTLEPDVMSTLKPIFANAAIPLNEDSAQPIENLKPTSQSFSKTLVDVAIDRCADTVPSTEAPAPAKSAMSEYHSPLDAIQQSQTSGGGGSSSAFNPDAVLCPFELQGSCDDAECVYQHLGVTT